MSVLAQRNAYLTESKKEKNSSEWKHLVSLPRKPITKM